jgi:hypothetical protein
VCLLRGADWIFKFKLIYAFKSLIKLLISLLPIANFGGWIRAKIRNTLINDAVDHVHPPPPALSLSGHGSMVIAIN